MALVTTAAASTANSYISLTDANAYFNLRLDGDVWREASGADHDRREASLFTAIRVLDALPFIGERQTETQALAWPRIGARPIERAPRNRRVQTGLEVLDASSGGIYDADGRFWIATAIPTPIKYAQCEIALAMLADPSLNDATLRQAVLRTSRLTIDHRRGAGKACEMAYEHLVHFIIKGVQLHKS